MKSLSWIKAVLSIFLLFGILVFSGCKKEQKLSMDVCLIAFGNDVMIVADYKIKDFCKRSIVYRSVDDKNYEVVGEIEFADMKNKQGVFIDTSIVFEGDYFYKVSYGGHLSNSSTIKFTKGNNPIRIYPNPFSDTLTIEFNAFCVPYDVLIFDILGRNVFGVKSNHNSYKKTIFKRFAKRYLFCKNLLRC